ncbi:MAG TPA: hypothetical protein ENK70_05460, partial [Methylophaga sp.]|nr:hypothetical protein [Methylophaga sp.]
IKEDDSPKRARVQFGRFSKDSESLADIFRKMEMDPEVTEQTLKQPYTNVEPAALMSATQRLIAIARGDEEENDRDSIAFQQIVGPDDLFAERIIKDSDKLVRQHLLWNSTNKGRITASSGFLNKQLDTVFTRSGLAQALEETNPVETLDHMYKVLRTGEAGISSEGVPVESRNVQSTHIAIIDPVRSPESGKTGLDSRFTINVRRGTDGQIYTMLRNNKGEIVPVAAKDAAHSIIAFPGEAEKLNKRVRVMAGGKIKFIDRNAVDYWIDDSSHMFSTGSNLVPMISSTLGPRLLMGGKFYNQALPMKDAEAPLVQSLSDDNKSSFEELYGTKAGAIKSDVKGRVVKVTDDEIHIKTAKGVVKKDLYHNFPFNRQSVTADSEITIKRNECVKVMRICEYTMIKGDRVLSVDNNTGKSTWSLITNFKSFDSGDKIILRVTTASGRSVGVTSDHSLITLDGKGDLVPVFPADVEVGKTRLPIAFINEAGVEVTEQPQAYCMLRMLLVGLYLAKGRISLAQPNMIVIAHTGDSHARQVIDLLNAARTSTEYRAYWHGENICLTDPELSLWLRSNFGRSSSSKHIPDFVFNLDHLSRAKLLSGYIAGSGCLHVDSNGDVQLCAKTASRSLRDGLVTLLSTLGVFATKSTIITPDDDGWGNAYCFRVLSGDVRRKFAVYPWFFYDDREDKLFDLLNDSYRSSPYSRLPAPKDKHDRKAFYAQFDNISHFIYKNVSAGSIPKKYLNRCTGSFRRWAESAVLWDTVVSIEPVAYDGFVYDLCVEDSEAFCVDGGLLVHNTYMHNTPRVAVGDHVNVGDLLASSNTTDANGTLALGKNLRTVYM